MTKLGEKARSFSPSNYAEYELLAFLGGIARIYPRLSGKAQRRIRGMLASGLDSNRGNLLSIQHEVTTAVHLRRQGFNVIFNDLESGGDFDFLARKGRIEAEGGCKMISGDLGRKIHLRRSRELFKKVEDSMHAAYKESDRGTLIRITIPDRLGASVEQHQGIKQTVLAALLNDDDAARSPFCEVRVTRFEIADSPFEHARTGELDKSRVSEFLELLTGQNQTHSVCIFSPGNRAAIVMLESQKKDEMLLSFRSVLKDSVSNQFTKRRPALLAVQIHDLSEDQLRELAGLDSREWESATGLQALTSRFLQSPNRSHVLGIAYRAHGKLLTQEGTTTADSVAYFIKNRDHPVASDPEYSVFSATPKKT